MKSNLLKLLFVSTILLGASYSASAQIYVKIRPIVPIIVRPPAPSSVHVWVNEEWEPDGNEYRYTGGHWESPPNAGDRWREGHWKRHHGDGQEWVRGNWKKGRGRR